MQEIMKSLEEHTRKLQSECNKATKEYDAILIHLADHAQKKQVAEGKIQSPNEEIIK